MHVGGYYLIEAEMPPEMTRREQERPWATNRAQVGMLVGVECEWYTDAPNSLHPEQRYATGGAETYVFEVATPVGVRTRRVDMGRIVAECPPSATLPYGEFHVYHPPVKP